MRTRCYGTDDDRIRLVLAGWTDSLAARHPGITRLEALDSVHTLVAVRRYDEFRDAMRALAAGAEPLTIKEIAGNDDIVLTGVAPRNWSYRGSPAQPLYALPLAADPSRKRVTMRVPVRYLLSTLRELSRPGGLNLDHIYDY